MEGNKERKESMELLPAAWRQGELRILLRFSLTYQVVYRNFGYETL